MNHKVDFETMVICRALFKAIEQLVIHRGIDLNVSYTGGNMEEFIYFNFKWEVMKKCIHSKCIPSQTLKYKVMFALTHL